MFSLLLLPLFFVTSCDNAPVKKRGKDGYYFEQETFTRTNFPVEVILVQSEKEMSALIQKRTGQAVGKISPKNVAAFAVIRNNDTKCTIYMLDPKVKYEPEYIGHELVHCIYGVWHKEPQT